MLLRNVLLLLFTLGSTIARAGDWDAYDQNVPRNELRETLNAYLENDRLRESRTGIRDPFVDDHAARLIRTYRTNRSQAVLSIKDAPFPFMLIAGTVNDIYPALYDKTWTEEYKKVINNIPLEPIFDAFMEGILNGTLPDSVRREASQVGECLARKVLRGRGNDCPLDGSDRLDVPSTAALAWIKLDCSLFNATSACFTRRTLFNKVKPTLIQARQQPEVRRLVTEEFAKRFPQEFRNGFLKEMSERLAGFPSLVAQKFSGELDPFWGARTPLVEPDGDNVNRLSMHGFASGLRADIGVAAMMAAQRDPQARGLAAALFYAAANRLLLLMGGEQAQWNGRNLVTSDGNVVDPRRPKQPPRFATDPFGGWGVEKLATGAAFTPWNWGEYDPTRVKDPQNPASKDPTPFRVFPGEFLVAGRGVPRLLPSTEPAETLSDLAELLFAGVDFLKHTKPDAVFGRNFGSPERMGELQDPRSPILFPRDGRMLAVGMMGAVLKNLVAPNVGHAEKKAEGSPDFGLGLAFHDRVTLAGREGQPGSVRGLARLLLAASELRKVMTTDPDVPQELKEYGPQVDTALQVGALTLGAQGQEGDGGFREKLGVRMAEGRTLSSLVAGMRALTRAHDESEMLVILIRIKQSWLFLDRLWGAGQIPRAVEGSGGRLINPSLLWELSNLWEETQKSVRPKLISGGLAPEINWTHWERRFDSLRRRLTTQLESDEGPELLGDLPSA
jgi:hypothetical protein